MRLAQRLSAVSLSPTLAVMMESKALKERGVDVVDFGPGEPDFDTPENIKRAAVEALRNNLTHYTDTGGLLDLRQAIAARYKERHGAGWGPDEVITGCGGKNVLFLVALSLFEAGDRVAIYAPYWVSFPEQVKLCGAAPVIIEAREADGFVSRARDLEAHRDLKAVIVNSPCNPSGAVIPPDEVERLAAFAARTGAWLISVEALNGPQDSVASMREEYRRRRDDLVRSLNGIRGIACTLPPGSFYVFPNVKGAMTALGCATSIEFARRLMTEIGVATVPGEAFGAPGYVRLSYALALDRIREGAGRLLRLLGRRDA